MHRPLHAAHRFCYRIVVMLRISWVRWILAALILAGLARAALVAVRTYRYEYSVLHWPREVPARPDWPELRDVEFGEGVRGWYAPPANGAVIVYLHGSPSNRTDQLPLARALAKAGFGALLFDLPGWGESAGQIDWAEPSRRALAACVRFAATQPKVAHLGAVGFSMGSGVLAVEAADDPRVEAMALVGAFTNQRAALAGEFAKWGPLTRWPARWAAERSGVQIDAPGSIDSIARFAPRPLLVIAGTADHTVPAEDSVKLFEAARQPKRLWLIPGARHGEYEQALGERYAEGLRDFFAGALLGHQPVGAAR